MMNWDEEIKNWYVIWEAPENPCDVYGACGPFGVCNTNGSPICECLKGFVPKSNEEWNKGNWTSGCVRRTELLCKKNTSGLASRRNKNDGFWKLSGMKLPDLFDFLYGEDGPGCQQWCLENCSCKAYSYVAGIGCMVWDAGLMDTQQFSWKGEDLFLRLAYSELGDEKGKIKLIISFTAISGCILLGAFLCGFHRWKVNQRGKRRDMVKGFDLADSIDTSKDTSRENVWGDHALQWDSSELPIFDFDKILVATNNFSKTNRLGGGGFGPVYKGNFLLWHKSPKPSIVPIAICYYPHRSCNSPNNYWGWPFGDD
ncbi:hypothetical protein F0562_018972 [Nyssa sinensis]|uniref:Apple domain-containing protein n=1 Tax=Nyssa sinensis TaxID=561372 RepID=A0A5J4ZDN8_9ASTE|nr:hypothetical protein F0562_018972 [Nyssa sinensis]